MQKRSSSRLRTPDPIKEYVPLRVSEWAKRGFSYGYGLISYDTKSGEFVIMHVRSTLFGSTFQIHYRGRGQGSIEQAYAQAIDRLNVEGFVFSNPPPQPRSTWYEFINKAFPANPALYRPLLAA